MGSGVSCWGCENVQNWAELMVTQNSERMNDTEFSTLND